MSNAFKKSSEHGLINWMDQSKAQDRYAPAQLQVMKQVLKRHGAGAGDDEARRDTLSPAGRAGLTIQLIAARLTKDITALTGPDRPSTPAQVMSEIHTVRHAIGAAFKSVDLTKNGFMNHDGRR